MRGKFSVLLWPSLYSTRAILLTPLAFVFAAGLVSLAFHFARQGERALTARASERVSALVHLKLSGAESWQWRQAMSCKNQAADCLPVKFMFAEQMATDHYVEHRNAPEACRICHAKDIPVGGSFSAVFTTLPPANQSRTGEIAVLIVIATLAVASIVFLSVLTVRRRRSGICVAAFECDRIAEKSVQKFIRQLATQRRLSYYGDAAAHRVRIATTPEKFAKILAQSRAFLEENRGSLRFAALHVDLEKNTLLPIEHLRGVFRFLARTPARTYLIQEQLATLLGQPFENERRLVFKNKSGALLKFVAWQAEKDETGTTGAE